MLSPENNGFEIRVRQDRLRQVCMESTLEQLEPLVYGGSLEREVVEIQIIQPNVDLSPDIGGSGGQRWPTGQREERCTLISLERGGRRGMHNVKVMIEYVMLENCSLQVTPDFPAHWTLVLSHTVGNNGLRHLGRPRSLISKPVYSWRAPVGSSDQRRLTRAPLQKLLRALSWRGPSNFPLKYQPGNLLKCGAVIMGSWRQVRSQCTEAWKMTNTGMCEAWVLDRGLRPSFLLINAV